MQIIKKTVPVLLFVAFYGCGFLGLTETDKGEEAITPELIHKYVFYLASDSLKGRNTPSPELDTAAAYIANEFKSFGVKPVNGSYFQNIPLGIISLGKANNLTINKNGKTVEYTIKDEFTPYEMTGNKKAECEIVFAGYGIDAPEFNYNDYKDVDVKGKIVFLLKHEPGENDSASIFDGREATGYSNLKEKVDIARQHGAAGILICQDPLNHRLLSPRGFPWPSLSKFIPNDALPLSMLMDEESKLPVVEVSEEVVNQLFGSVENLKSIQAEIDRNMAPKSFIIPDTKVFLKTSTSIKNLSAKNVVGYIEGSDPELKDEVVVLGAHYDHVGYIKNHNEGEDYIYNGADDNASGTSTLLAAAKAFGVSGKKPKRSVLFIAFAGEEKGLFGSRYYVEHPLFPIGKTIAMLNMDMVGRNNPDSLQIIAYSKCPELTKINEEENKSVGFKLYYAPGDKSIGGSDHMSFLKKDIPSLFYHTGLEGEYHKVIDEADLIDTVKAARVAKLVYKTAGRLANEKIYPKVVSSTNSIF